MKSIAHCNLVTEEYGLTVSDSEVNNIELRIILTDELVELSQTEPVNLYRIDQSGAISTVASFSDMEINEISVSFGETTSDYEVGIVQYYVGATGYTSEIIKFNIAKTLDVDSDNIYIEYENGVFEIKKETLNGNKFLESYSIGSVYITTENINPSSYLGGEWELIDKEFAQDSGNATITADNTNTTSCTCEFIRSGHCVYLQVGITNKVALADGTLDFATIDLLSLGVTALEILFRELGYSDGGNHAVMFGLTTDGVIQSYDALPNETMSAGANIYVDFQLVLKHNQMVDSACNKFYWKRTA